MDTSDASYCRRTGSFDTYLAKYRHDAYKAKSFIHQMASRCFSTAICNIQAGLLNSTLIDDDNFELILPPASVSNLTSSRKSPRPTPPPVEEEDKEEHGGGGGGEPVRLVNRPTVTRSPSFVLPSTTTIRTRTSKTRLPSTKPPGGKTNIWDRFTVNHKSRTTAKYIPFWQRLLSTTPLPNGITPTLAPSSGSEEETFEEIDEDEDVNEEKNIVEKGFVAVTTTMMPITTTMTTAKTTTIITQQKYTWRPLIITAAPIPAAAVPEFFKAQKPTMAVAERPAVFWNRFQPGRWYQSIHYVTNTG